MFHEGYSIERIHDLSKIDLFWLQKLRNIVDTTHELEDVGFEGITKALMNKAKCQGFSDIGIAKAAGSDEETVRQLRKKYGITPWVKKIDTLAAEFPANTNYLYTSYSGSTHDVDFTDKGTLVLGSGVYRIGSSVEFDWGKSSCLGQSFDANSLQDQALVLWHLGIWARRLS